MGGGHGTHKLRATLGLGLTSSQKGNILASELRDDYAERVSRNVVSRNERFQNQDGEGVVGGGWLWIVKPCDQITDRLNVNEKKKVRLSQSGQSGAR